MSNISFYSKEEHSDDVLSLLRQRLPDHQIYAWPEIACKGEELSYAICWHPPLTFFRGTRNLKTIFSLAAGVDHLLNHPELPADVPIVRLTDAGMGDKIAEYVHYGVLRTHRGFDKYQSLQKQQSWQPQPDRDASDYRVGVLGFGVIGRIVAMRLYKAGYRVTAFRRSVIENSDPFPVLWGNIADFLGDLDTLVCVLPLTEETTNIINSELLSNLPRGANFINVGRGTQVVESDLLDALDSGQLATALLDVCATEPLPIHHRFWSHEKITITPHVAGPTQLMQSVAQIASSISRLDAGEDVRQLKGLVETNKGY